MPTPRSSNTGAARPHDWRAGGAQQRPHLRTLVRMHEVLVEQLAPALSRQLRCEVDLELAATELATFDEYLRSMPMVTVVTTYKMLPLEGRCAVELNPQLATVMVERMLGGPGTLPQLRRLTALESAALTEVVDVFETALASTFAPVVELQVRHDEIVFDPEFLDVAEGQDTVILLAYRIRLRAEEGTTEGIVTLCYPTSQLAPVLRHLSAADLSDVGDEPAARPVGPLVDHLPDVNVPVTVRLNPTTMMARDIAELAPGDVLRLDHRLGEPVVGFCGDSELFEGNLGQRRRRLGIQVVGVRQTPAAADQGTPVGLPALSAGQGGLPDPLTNLVNTPVNAQELP